jgi:hypothetical protein
MKIAPRSAHAAPRACPSSAAPRRACASAAAHRRPLRVAAAAADAMATEWASKVVELPPFARGSHVVTSQLLAKLPEVFCSESSSFLDRHMKIGKVPSHTPNNRPQIAEFEVGLAHFFLQHTSASLTVNENASPDVPLVSSAASLVGQSKQKTSWKPTSQPNNPRLPTTPEKKKKKKKKRRTSRTRSTALRPRGTSSTTATTTRCGLKCALIDRRQNINLIATNNNN